MGSGGRRPRADPLLASATQHARRNLFECRGARVVPIFDQGYQHWSGQLSGHAWRWLAITRHGVRIGSKNRFLRLLLILSWLPAIALVLVLCMWGLLERKSAVIQSLMPFITFLHPE